MWDKITNEITTKHLNKNTFVLNTKIRDREIPQIRQVEYLQKSN